MKIACADFTTFEEQGDKLIVTQIDDGYDATHDPIPGDYDERLEQFCENHCHSCEHYYDTKDYEEENDDGALITGSILSPCPAYRNGLESISSPCMEGLDLPDEDDLSSEQDYEAPPIAMRLSLPPVITHAVNDSLGLKYAGFASVDVLVDECNNKLEITDSSAALNTYGRWGRVCWNGNTATSENALSLFKSTNTNDDLGSLESFQDETRYFQIYHLNGDQPGGLPDGLPYYDDATALALFPKLLNLELFVELQAFNIGIGFKTLFCLPLTHWQIDGIKGYACYSRDRKAIAFFAQDASDQDYDKNNMTPWVFGDHVPPRLIVSRHTYCGIFPINPSTPSS